jgi:hypothetical protein
MTFFAQFHGAILSSSSRSGSSKIAHWIASFETSLNEVIVERVPIADKARLAISTSEVISAYLGSHYFRG